jgi:hypothetical protein
MFLLKCSLAPVIILSVALVLPMVTSAQIGAPKMASISPSDLPDDPGPQHNPLACWAASIGYIFAFYDHPVSQEAIVSRFYGRPIVVAGTPLTMSKALNSDWPDQQFSIRSRITDRLWGTASQVDNDDVVDALNNNTPVFYGTTNHAMVLVAVTYVQPAMGTAIILSGTVWDPNPIYHQGTGNGVRTVQGADLQATFVAIPERVKTVQQAPIDTGAGQPSPPAQADALATAYQREAAFIKTVPNSEPPTVNGSDYGLSKEAIQEALTNAPSGFNSLVGKQRSPSPFIYECVLKTPTVPTRACELNWGPDPQLISSLLFTVTLADDNERRRLYDLVVRNAWELTDASWQRREGSFGRPNTADDKTIEFMKGDNDPKIMLHLNSSEVTVIVSSKKGPT